MSVCAWRRHAAADQPHVCCTPERQRALVGPSQAALALVISRARSSSQLAVPLTVFGAHLFLGNWWNGAHRVHGWIDTRAFRWLIVLCPIVHLRCAVVQWVARRRHAVAQVPVCRKLSFILAFISAGCLKHAACPAARGSSRSCGSISSHRLTVCTGTSALSPGCWCILPSEWSGTVAA